MVTQHLREGSYLCVLEFYCFVVTFSTIILQDGFVEATIGTFKMLRFDLCRPQVGAALSIDTKFNKRTVWESWRWELIIVIKCLVSAEGMMCMTAGVIISAWRHVAVMYR